METSTNRPDPDQTNLSTDNYSHMFCTVALQHNKQPVVLNSAGDNEGITKIQILLHLFMVTISVIPGPDHMKQKLVQCSTSSLWA